MTLTIWYNAALSEAATGLLRAGTGAHQLVAADARVITTGRGQHDEQLAHADVAFGQPFADQVLALERLRWVQLTSAGYAAYDRDDLRAALRRRGGVLTKSSLVFDEPCAEHLLAFMLAHARQLPQAFANQTGGRAWPQLEIRGRSRLLSGQRVVLFGFGSIARRLCELLRPFGMDLLGVRRRVSGDEPIPVLALDDSATAGALNAADHVVNILPASPSSDLFFDAARFSTLKAGAVFYNIGRGTTVDQEALRAALGSGQLGGAYLDVTDPEPLPPSSPLWSAPRCVITPHTAGGHDGEDERLVHHFLENLARFSGDRPLLDRVT